MSEESIYALTTRRRIRECEYKDNKLYVNTGMTVNYWSGPTIQKLLYSLKGASGELAKFNLKKISIAIKRTQDLKKKIKFSENS